MDTPFPAGHFTPELRFLSDFLRIREYGIIFIMDDFLKTEKVFTILEINTAVQRLIRSEFPEYVWVCGEIQDFRSRGHLHFNLVQKHPEANEIVAQVKAVVFENVAERIARKLKQADARFVLRDDIEVKLLCRVGLSPKWGLYSLEVYDIDPIYTLGKLAQDRQRIIDDLRKKGLLERNKQHSVSQVPLRIGLVTAHNSAAYHDFISELQGSNFAFQLILFDAFMQGKNVESDLLQAFRLFENLGQEELDVIVITRGGGSTADLSWFDNQRIAEKAALCTFPVFTALGHEINTTILDLVAHTSFKTPTKVAQFLVERVSNFRQSLDAHVRDILQSAREYVESRDRALASLAGSFSLLIAEFFTNRKGWLIEQKTYLKTTVLHELESGRKRIELLRSDFFGAAQQYIKICRERLSFFENSFELLNPKNVLKRGFSITLHKNVPVRQSQKVTQGDELITLLYQGRITSKVSNIKEEDEK